MEVILSAALGVLAGFVTAVIKSRVDVAAQVDKQLRDTRATEYKGLWKQTAILPRWPKRDDVTFGELQGLQVSLKEWYFGSGGLYLSRRSFDRYADLQEALTSLGSKDRDAPVPQDVYEAVRAKCSALRSSLTDDLLSRRPQSLWTF